MVIFKSIDWETIKGLSIPAGVVLTWLTKDRILVALNIKKEKNTATSGHLENVQKALDLWQEMLDDAIKRHKLQVSELDAVAAKIKDDLQRLESINEKLEAIVNEQRDIITKQSKKIDYYKRKYDTE
jgi:predicted transcriptional regulator